MATGKSASGLEVSMGSLFSTVSDATLLQLVRITPSNKNAESTQKANLDILPFQCCSLGRCWRRRPGARGGLCRQFPGGSGGGLGNCWDWGKRRDSFRWIQFDHRVSPIHHPVIYELVESSPRVKCAPIRHCRKPFPSKAPCDLGTY